MFVRRTLSDVGLVSLMTVLVNSEVIDGEHDMR